MKKITRRQALGTAAGTLTALGAAAVVVRASASGPRSTDPQAAGPTGPGPSLPAKAVDEVYQGRRIQITLAAGGHHDGHHLPGMPTVRIDGSELHLMPNADGSWISVVHHYETFPDPISAARAAVRELQGAELAPFASTGGTP